MRLYHLGRNVEGIRRNFREKMREKATTEMAKALQCRFFMSELD